MRIQLEPPTSDFKGIIDYHYKKINNDVAQLLESPLMENSQQKAELIELFETIASQNSRVKYPCQHISINLQHGESLSNQQYISLAKEYLKQMQWDNSPFAIVRHMDKKHSHIHIVLSTVDYEGNKIDMYNSKRKTTELTPVLEKQYNLLPTPKISHACIKLSEHNQHKFLVQNLLRKVDNDPKTQQYLYKIYTKEELNDIKNNHYSNQEIQDRYPDQYQNTFVLFEKFQLIETLLKEQLTEKLEKIYTKSNSHSQFFEELSKADIYFRHITKKGKSYYVYGDKNLKFYAKDTTLNEKFRSENLRKEMPFSTSTEQKFIPISTQKHLIYNAIKINLQTSTNYQQLKESLQKSNIEIIEHKNSSGIFGISFSLQESHCQEPVTFKASEINRQFSFTKLINHFSQKQEIPPLPMEEIAFLRDENQYYLPDQYQSILAPRGVSYNRDDDFDSNMDKDKKKRKKGRDNRPII